MGLQTVESSFRNYNKCPPSLSCHLSVDTPKCGLPWRYVSPFLLLDHVREGPGVFLSPRVYLKICLCNTARREVWKKWGTRHFRKTVNLNGPDFLLLTLFLYPKDKYSFSHFSGTSVRVETCLTVWQMFVFTDMPLD